LHGVTLESVLSQLVEHFGWDVLAKRINVNCFKSDPSVKSSLKFLRKTPWARDKVERLYLRTFPVTAPVDAEAEPAATRCANNKEETPVSVESSLTPGIYRHYKGPEYELIDVATHTETEESFAVYRALYGEYGLWIRPLAMFMETVDVDGEVIPRFRLIRAFGN
jgi:uncharacterized protein (DUF2132 family)